jgi:hypothetical protein
MLTAPLAVVRPATPSLTVPASISLEFHAALEQAGAKSRLRLLAGAGHAGYLLDAMGQERRPLVAGLSRLWSSVRWRLINEPPSESALHAQHCHVMAKEAQPGLVAHRHLQFPVVDIRPGLKIAIEHGSSGPRSKEL